MAVGPRASTQLEIFDATYFPLDCHLCDSLHKNELSEETTRCGPTGA